MSNNLQISPIIIEKELLEHPNVKEAVVFGVLTDIHGEYPTAAVTVYDKEKFDKQELKQFIQGNIILNIYFYKCIIFSLTRPFCRCLYGHRLILPTAF